ncbi:chorismate-binding protein, partial [Candidatus Pelagibacter bacterium]|nr:chorismate-binding protein [Candidatus Pelagibacter bacterium]
SLCKVFKINSVKVTESFIIERYSHVMHIVSNVVGEYNKKFSKFKSLLAGFPAGTVSGAPKIRAMEIIDEALTHGGIDNKVKVNLVRIDSEKLKVSEIKKKLKNISGILIPGGFGKRGTDGKIEAIKHARLNKIPFLGICYGMQMAIIEFARNQLNLKNATSSEFDKKGLPIIGLINEWTKDGKMIKGTDKDLGGTMRLGSYDAKLKDNSLIRKIYKSKLIKERHRHRYEVNIAFKDKFEKKGMIFSGLSPDNKLPEIIELKNHPWFIGVQFHPEFKSRPLAPHPLFSSFIKAAKNHK